MGEVEDADELSRQVREAVGYEPSGDSSDDARVFAEQHGLIVRVPAKNELFVDIDSDSDYEKFTKNRHWVEATVRITAVTATKSRNKPQGMHIVVTCGRDIEPMERCLLQAILGSDLVREGHSYKRIIDGDAFPTMFFENEDYATRLSTSD